MRSKIFAVAVVTMLVGATSYVFLVGRRSAPGDQPRPEAGPVVLSGGAVFEVPDPDFPTPMDHDLGAVFELRSAPEDPARTNEQLGTMARYLNMHARAGVPRENLRVAAVVHGGASRALLQDDFYRERVGVENPNTELVREIIAAGGEVILCGQSAAAQNISREQLLPGVKVALSAMTALVTLQQQGYELILW
jgi:intracellular sulfur oxidation DsrE/DsrF family protein